jgi:putative membrane protein insertion efficiency factor
MSALRQPIRQRLYWIILITAVVLGAAAIFDWMQPPRQQVSVALYQRVVIGGYRLALKPLAGRFIHCRFQPTCSHYSEEAMLEHGFPKGLWLTTSRLFRCMPWVPVGTRDPVPKG